jgi:hypothetical protein
MAPKGPYKLCTVNKIPERAKLVVGRFIEGVKDTYMINHVENAERMFFFYVASKKLSIDRMLRSQSA